MLTLPPTRSALCVGVAAARQSAYGDLRLMLRMVTVGREVMRDIRLGDIHVSEPTSVAERHRPWSWVQLGQIGPFQSKPL